MELQELKEQLIEWMNKMKHGYRDSGLYMTEITNNGRVGIKLKLFTETNDYAIVAYAPTKTYKGYLGAMGGTRKPRAGEDWTRGNDLADGEFSEQTWIKILHDIIGYELVKIQRPISLLYEEKQNVRCSTRSTNGK